MDSTTLQLEVLDKRFFLNCGPLETIKVGSDPSCKISLDAKDVLPHHCTLVRTGPETFLIEVDNPAAKVKANGVPVNRETVTSPFRLRVASHKLRLEIVPDSEAAELPNVIGAVVPKRYSGTVPATRKSRTD